ncbi:MAG: winged helix DNA-binding domain-containing protein [Hamadaea sp.]|uniref:winged helix DNA-binding domain-containing protein n=1 Tax=Hamadaea sp. TaxID=2024425 RepID=UPI0017F96790|nr:winged helix DNA-binding domain-containing protein [Hamadaea sp.]NUR70907.1 winged helix DNA-binding domain-containing protein [Hamadaea sp.]NUT21694.1 winged helix DNA-binding domain-containing protein [Hamadaea sp.]
MIITWDQVFAWRMRRHLLDRPKGTSAVDVAHRLCGVQAQVASSAEQAVAARRQTTASGEVAKALANRELVKTWAMRGTLHLLCPADAPAFLALMAATKVWEKPIWQRNFVTAAQLKAIAEAAWTALDGAVLTREQLTEAVLEHSGDVALAEHLGSGWGAVLKPLAYQGLLVYGPSDGSRVTFTRPDTYLDGWPGLPDPAEAARTAVPAYLGAFGPATIEAFNQWITRGTLKKTDLKKWYAELTADGVITAVDVEGTPAYALTSELDAIAMAKPFDDVRLLPAFDQYVLGPGTQDEQLIGAGRRPEISKAAGWISPVVVHRGRVAGVWESDGDTVSVRLFTERADVPKTQIASEAARITGGKPKLDVTVG